MNRSSKFLSRSFASRWPFSLFALAAGLAGNMEAATYTVSTVADSGAGSLRQAILSANANLGLDTIAFNLPGPGPFTISPLTPLPAITDPVLLDGRTQPGYAGTPLIEINGASLTGGTDGLFLASGGSTVSGLAINRCPRDAIRLQSLGTNLIQANFLGTDLSGTLARPNGEGGVYINGSPGNLIGGINPSEENLISGGNQNGVYLIGSTASGNMISANYIGTSVTGRQSLGNALNGVEISAAPANLVGGTDPGAGNVLSGNNESGVYVFTSGATGNLIQGNYIGVNSDGTAALSNKVDGITIYGVPSNTVGGVRRVAGNIISGNGNTGVDILTAGATGNTLLGNYIGTDVSGRQAIPNQANGVIINGVPGNTIGGTLPGSGNTISGNQQNGVLVVSAGASGNMIQGNYLGVDATGTNALPNTFNGISIDGAAANFVGGVNGGNVISGNDANGVLLVDSGGGANTVQANLIGTDSKGKTALGNAQAGIYIQVPGNTIGGSTPALRNVISGNSQNGVFIYSALATNNLLIGNYIGTDISGTFPLGNGYAGAAVLDAPANTIGGTSAGEGNLISANENSGITLSGTTTSATTIQGNYIGTDATGTSSLANIIGGIYLYGSGNNTIGGVVQGAGNLVSGNLQEGISIGDPGANFNVIQGNFLGTKADGVSPLGNQLHNIDFSDTASNNLVGGTSPAADNRIAFVQSSLYDGIRIRSGCGGNFVSHNNIYSNGNLGIVIGDFPGLNTANLVALTNATSDGLTTTGIQGFLNTYPNGSFLIQFYENDAPNPSGYGEGKTYIGSANVNTGVGGLANFVLAFPVGISSGKFISATATDSANTTWEFSADVQVLSPSLLNASPSIATTVPAVSSLSRLPIPTPDVTGVGNIQAIQPPTLAITQSNPSTVPATITLTWPQTSANFILQQANSLTPPISWFSSTNPVTVQGGTNRVTATQSGTAMFYRLAVQ